MDLFTVPKVKETLDFLYEISKDTYCGGLSKQGNLTKLVCNFCRKRGIMRFNGKPVRPEWTWVATMAPTKELAKNIFKDIQSFNEHRYKLRGAQRGKPKVVIEAALPASPVRTKEDQHPLAQYDAKFLVDTLRERGYTVTCTKTIEL